MPDGQNQHDIFCREPAILGDVAITAAREDELPAALLRLAPQQRVIGQQFERAAYAYELFAGSSGVFFGDEIEETLEISYRPLCYFDARHARDAAVGMTDAVPVAATTQTSAAPGAAGSPDRITRISPSRPG